MADLDWGRAAAGFVGGALTGYQQVLTTKMKEDSENRMEEARMMRQQSMEQWRNVKITTPNRIIDQTFAKDQQDRGFTHAETLQQQGFTHSETLAQQQMTHAENQRRLSDQAADKRYERENSPEAFKAKALAIHGAQNAIRKEVGDEVYKFALSEYKNDSVKALIEQANYMKSGANSLEEYNKYKASSNSKLAEAVNEAARKPVQTEVSAIQADLKDNPGVLQERLGQEFGLTAKSPGEAARLLTQLKTLQITSDIEHGMKGEIGVGGGGDSKTKEQPAGVSKEDWSNNLAEGVRRQNAEALKLYNNLSPKEQRDIDSRKSQLQQVEEAKFKDDYDSRSRPGASTLSGQQRKYLTPNNSQNQIYIPMPK